MLRREEPKADTDVDTTFETRLERGEVTVRVSKRNGLAPSPQGDTHTIGARKARAIEAGRWVDTRRDMRLRKGLDVRSATRQHWKEARRREQKRRERERTDGNMAA
ncbi:MAG: hypothetical protein HY457_02015 [Parcubacteria group bacterium]|nr:hypothetical protein [Parcubacteria group bacterium]